MSRNLLPSRDSSEPEPHRQPAEFSDAQPLVDAQQLLSRFRSTAADEGFVLCGVSPALQPSGYPNLIRWIESGYGGEMHYIADRKEAYRHPDAVLEDVRTVIALAYPYPESRSQSLPSNHGQIARYAGTGVDYHDALHPKLKRLCQVITGFDKTMTARGVIDTAPLMEREFAQLAGLGWRGKNTLLLNKEIGSYFFLACVLTNAELAIDPPHEAFHCGTCRACLDACPTKAFPQPGVLDATKCISYLTIEHRSAIADELRPGIGNWLFGCDVCQEVCPWNEKRIRQSESVAFADRSATESIDLLELFTLDDEAFRTRFKKTPLWRPRRRGILRNAAIVLGNQRNRSAVGALSLGLNDEEPLVRGACAWALGQIGSTDGLVLLRARQHSELDAEVRDEIARAIAQGDFHS